MSACIHRLPSITLFLLVFVLAPSAWADVKVQTNCGMGYGPDADNLVLLEAKNL